MKKTNTCVIALDVGGSHIGSALVGPDLQFISEPISTKNEHHLPQEQLLEVFNEIINKMLVTADENNVRITNCSMAFPGPFDYSEGISLMEHKFKALNGINLKDHFEKTHNLPVVFLNDADAFGYGILRKELTEEPSSLVTITLGTGIGVSYFRNGKLADLEIWNTPYKQKNLEYYISGPAISRAYEERVGKKESVEAIASMAKAGDEDAIFIFNQFGSELGQGLAETVSDLNPYKIVLGGGICKSFELFGNHAAEAYRLQAGQEIPLQAENDTNLSLCGAATYSYELSRNIQ